MSSVVTGAGNAFTAGTGLPQGARSVGGVATPAPVVALRVAKARRHPVTPRFRSTPNPSGNACARQCRAA
jgi:hypothetical protein